MESNDKMVGSAVAAALLHVDQSTLRRWQREGKLDDVRSVQTAGKHYRWNEQDLIGYAQRLAAGETGEPNAVAELAVPTERLGERCPSCRDTETLRAFCPACQEQGRVQVRTRLVNERRKFGEYVYISVLAFAMSLPLLVVMPNMAVATANAERIVAKDRVASGKDPAAKGPTKAEIQATKGRWQLAMVGLGAAGAAGVLLLGTVQVLRGVRDEYELTEWAPFGSDAWSSPMPKPMIDPTEKHKSDHLMTGVLLGAAGMAILADD